MLYVLSLRSLRFPFLLIISIAPAPFIFQSFTARVHVDLLSMSVSLVSVFPFFVSQKLRLKAAKADFYM